MSGFRRQGVGRRLTERRIERAKGLEASAIYVSCWEGGYAPKLYEHLGFMPILRSGPRYNDGHGEKTMVFLLEDSVKNAR